MQYCQLEKLSAWEYLNPSSFITDFDGLPSHINRGYALKQHNKGIEIGKEYHKIHIDEHSLWSASSPNSLCSSYEGIGYHACTADLLSGFLQSPAAIIVHRLKGENLVSQIIKPSGYWLRHELTAKPVDVTYLFGQCGQTEPLHIARSQSEIISILSHLLVCPEQ
jgi:hypothetical protein